MITRSSVTQLLYNLIDKNWLSKNQTLKKRYAKGMFNMKNSNKSFEFHNRIATFGAAPGIADNLPIPTEDINEVRVNQYTHLRYGLGFILSDSMARDDRYGIARSLTADLAKSMDYTCELIGAAYYNAAFTTNGPDGVPLCSDSHPISTGGVVSNLITAALDAIGLEEAVLTFRAMKDEEGKYIDVEPNLLVVPRGLEFTAKRLRASTGFPTVDLNQILNGGQSNYPPNDKNLFENLYPVLDNPYLTDSNDWFLRGASGDEDSLIWYWRQTPDLMKFRDNKKRAEEINSEMWLSVGHSGYLNITGSSVSGA